MEAQKTLSAINTLCEKVCKLIDLNTEKVAELEKKIAELEKRQVVMLNTSQVAKATGWSIAAVAKWIDTGLIEVVRVDGLKKPLVPSTEVDKIIKMRGYGKKHMEGR